MVDAVRCAIEMQNGLIERNAGLSPDRRIEFRVGIHLGDVVEESDGDLMGDGVNIAARLEGVCAPGAICLSEAAYWQVKGRLDMKVSDLGPTQLKNIAEPIRVYALDVDESAAREACPRSAVAGASCGAQQRLRAQLVGERWPAHDRVAALLFLAAAGSWAMLGGRLDKAALKPRSLDRRFALRQSLRRPGPGLLLLTGSPRISPPSSAHQGSFVIARNTAFTYKGKSVDPKEIGKELGVRYLLEGSVQRGGTRMRVNVQLIDAETGNHLWADRFEPIRPTSSGCKMKW